MVGNKIANKITSISKKKSNNNNNNDDDDDDDDDVKLSTHKKDIYHQKKDIKLLMN